MKFTFTTEHPTGAYRSFYSSSHHIKLKKKKCGLISGKTLEISLMVVKTDINEDGNPNCTWKWITLAKNSNTLQEAKDWLNDNIASILAKYQIHLLED